MWNSDLTTAPPIHVATLNRIPHIIMSHFQIWRTLTSLLNFNQFKTFSNCHRHPTQNRHLDKACIIDDIDRKSESCGRWWRGDDDLGQEIFQGFDRFNVLSLFCLADARSRLLGSFTMNKWLLFRCPHLPCHHARLHRSTISYIVDSPKGPNDVKWS